MGTGRENARIGTQEYLRVLFMIFRNR